MNDRKLYQQEKQAILDDYEEELKELKEMASASNAEAQNEFNKQIKTVGLEITDAKIKLEAVEKASEEEIESHKKLIDDSFMAINRGLTMS
jgi:hypothetical protein